MSAHTTETQLRLIGKLLLEGDLHCETGLHVGAGKGSLEIGSSDNPVIKDAFGRPYIPGSSLRGRLRSLLEQSSGLTVPAELVYLSRRRGQEVRIHQSDRPDDEICILFGRNSGRMDRVVGDVLDSSQSSPARLAAYDAPLDPESITPQMRENLDDELTEVKSENAVDRITSQANPRTLERVPAGARFRVRFVMDVLCEEDAPLFARVVAGPAATLSLGLLGEWLEATARNPAGADVRFSSVFPLQGDTGFVVPPKNIWPPSASSKVRWKGARFIPLPLVEQLLNGGALEED